MALPLILDVFGGVIAAGQSLSSFYTFSPGGAGVVGSPVAGGVMLGADTLAGIQMPAVWTAASLTFQVSPDGGTTWCELYDDTGAEVTVVSPPAGSFIIFNTHASYQWRGINAVKIRSGTAASS